MVKGFVEWTFSLSDNLTDLLIYLYLRFLSILQSLREVHDRDRVRGGVQWNEFTTILDP